MSAFVWDGAVARDVTQVRVAGETVDADALRAMPTGYPDVDTMLTRSPFYMAHRGGSKLWPEMSLHAYTQSVNWGIGMLEVSLARTSDGVWFGLHDENLDRVAGTTGAVPASSMTWAQVQQYQINPPSGTTQPARPFMRIEELLRAYGNTHIIMFDPKYQSGAARTNELIDLMLQYVPVTRIMGKNFYTGRTFAATCKARGVKTWGYAYEADAATLAGYVDDWDLFGMNYDASQAAWDTVLSYGKPVIGHICDSEAAVTTALAKGADGLQLSNPLAVPRRGDGWTPPPPPADTVPTFRTAASMEIGSTTGTRSLTIPAQVQDGDLGIIVFGQDAAADTISVPPAGWTQFVAPFAATNSKVHIYYRVKQPGDTTVSYTGTAYTTATAYWWGGTSGIGTLGVLGKRAASGTTVVAPSITAAPGDHVVVLCGERTIAGPDAIVSTTWGTVKHLAAGLNTGGGSGITSSAVIEATATGGATGDNTITYHGSSGNAWAMQFTLVPAVAKWTENWESWSLGTMTVKAPVTLVTGGPTIVTGFDGKAAESGPGSRRFTVSVAGMSHWSCDFTVRMSGTQTGNNYVASVVDSTGTYVGELNLRLTEKQIWNRINFGADVKSRSVWTYAADPSTVRIVYEWCDDEFVKCHLFYGTNLNGLVPNETTIYDKTMAAGIIVGKRVEGVRFGNDTTTGITQQFDNLTLRDLS